MHSKSQTWCHVLEAGIPPMGLTGTLSVPDGAVGAVVFAGTGRVLADSPHAVLARSLRDARLATLVFDLLDPEEIRERDNVLFLADRVEYAIGYVRSRPETSGLPVCLFGSDAGAAATLISAGSVPSLVDGVVTRAGRPDRAMDMLGHVRAPTLFIVDGNDAGALAGNLAAKAMMTCETGLTVLPGAASGRDANDRERKVAALAVNWFRSHLQTPGDLKCRPDHPRHDAGPAAAGWVHSRDFALQARKT